ncbi:MAG: hypothetical protein U0470_01680 [Anaerolineae bacterium]
MPEDAGTAYYDYGRAKAISWLADGFGVEIPAAAQTPSCSCTAAAR